MANLTGQDLVDRIADIGLTSTHASIIVNDSQFNPNHVINPAVPPSLSKVLVTSETSIIKAINELKIRADSADSSNNQKINDQYAVIGDYITFPDKLTRLDGIDADILEALDQVNFRLEGVEPAEPAPSFGSMVPTPNRVGIGTTVLQIPLTPIDGEMSLDTANYPIQLIRDNGSLVVNTTNTISSEGVVSITLNQPFETGEDYTLRFPRKSIRNGNNPNKAEQTQALTIATTTSTPLLDLLNAEPAPGSTGNNFLLTDRVVIPISSTNHLNQLAVDDSKIDVIAGGSVKSATPSEIVDERDLIIYLDTPLAASTTYTVDLQAGALADGTALMSATSFTFTTAAVSNEVLVQKDFSISYGDRDITDDQIDTGFNFIDFMDDDAVYNVSGGYDPSDRQVYLFKKRLTGGTLNIEIVKLSSEYDPALDMNDFGSFYDIHVEDGLLTFGHDIIERDYDYELVVFAIKKTAAEALSWATTNLT